MPTSGGRAAVLGAAAAALVAGAAAGWLVGRASAPPPPPPPVFVNPLADAKKDETLVLDGPAGRSVFRVLETTGETVLLAVDRSAPGAPSSVRQIRVARSFLGALLILEGDVPPDDALATMRDFVPERMEPDVLFVAAVSRSFRCWKLTGRHRVFGEQIYWISDELPVHGVVRIDGSRGTMVQVTGFGFGRER